ncbi:MAG: cation transporter [Chloroflexi bacterium]|nr:cation transporter [Chloroflexota bacterium]
MSAHSPERTEQRASGGASRDEVNRAKAMRANLISSGGLTLTSLFELAIALVSGSVALLVDALHNLADSYTTVAIYFGFRMSRRAATSRYPYGFGRAEDVAGVVIVVAIWSSAALAFYQTYEKFVSGSPTTHLTLGMVAAVIGIAGNQIAGRYKIRVGREIKSVPLIVDGKHSLLDAVSSAGALVGLVGVGLGFPQADPIAGVAIGLLIVHIGIDATKEVAARLMDANDEELARAAATIASTVPGVTGVNDVRARWLGREVELRVGLQLAPEMSLRGADQVSEQVRQGLREQIADVRDIVVFAGCSDRRGDGA